LTRPLTHPTAGGAVPEKMTCIGGLRAGWVALLSSDADHRCVTWIACPGVCALVRSLRRDRCLS
jgi:hypothetical protein